MEQTLTLDALSFFKEVRDLYKETDRRIKEMSQDTDRKFRRGQGGQGQVDNA